MNTADMESDNFFTSKTSVQLSMLIGKYLPKQFGYWLSQKLGAYLGGRRNLDISQAIRVNQYVARDMLPNLADLVDKTKQVLTHAGKCFVDLYRVYNKPERLDQLAPLSRTMQEFIDLTNQKQGYMVVAPHISNFDLIVISLVRHGFRGIALSYPNPGPGYLLQNQLRERLGVQIVPLGDPATDAKVVDLLKDGGIAATGVDRPVPTKKRRHYINFFDRPSPLPVGYIRTALAADVPIIAVTGIMEPDGTYGFRYTQPMELIRTGDRLEEIKLNAEQVLRKVEEFIRLAPEQWLMFYPVWPDLLPEVI